jgi:hypothetical protein
MKFENFTKHLKARLGSFTRLSFLPALLLFMASGTVSAQCPLVCNNNVQISLDDNCEVEVTPAMVLEGEGINCNYEVVILGPNNQMIPNSPFVDGQYIGRQLTVEVRNSSNGNSCWGYITIEDKLPPVIDCPGDITLNCYDPINVSPPPFADNCGDATISVLSDVVTDLDCNSDFSAQRVISYQAEDASGNLSAICTRTIFIDRVGLDSITFPRDYDDVELPSLSCTGNPWDRNDNGYPDVEETGAPTTPSGSPIFPNNSLCELNATFEDQVLDICESSFKVLRRWTILDWCSGEVEEDFQIIKVVDNEGPIITCPLDFPQLSADPYDCTADWLVDDPLVVFDCSGTTYTVGYLLADNTGNPPPNGIYISDNVINVNGQYIIQDLPLGRTWIKYTVTDNCGNSTECFTEVDVVDDVPPVPVCDENTVVTLTTQGVALVKALTFDDGSHDNCSEVYFDARRMTSGCGASTTEYTEYVEFCCADVGREVMVELRVRDSNGNENTCMVNVNVQDKINPVIICPDDITLNCGQDYEDLSLTGEPIAQDNCGIDSLTSVDTGSLNQCGVGVISRRWTVTDNGGRTATCVQTITVEDDDPFTSADITWPKDVDLTGCMNTDTDISNTGEPTYPDDACSLVAYTFNDQTFEFVDGACFKILRTFTVIDWCTFDQSNPQNGGMYQRTQIIKLNNFEAPTLNNVDDITVCAFGPNCSDQIELILDATDDCTPIQDLVISYSIDIDMDGSIDATGNNNNASRELSVGTHEIVWNVEDRCGNRTTDSYLITVEDCKKPTPYCLSEITTVVMPSTGQISIWANDFDLGSTDNCPGDLRFSFSSDVNNTSATFTCDQLGINTLEMWVTDASGNQDFCEVRINIQANEGCDGSSPAVSGRVNTESNEMVPEVMVRLENMGSSEMQYFQTQENGTFAFADFIDQYYQLTADRNDFHDNGVTTLDLVLIQRHILGLSPLNSPLKVIAADINNNESVTGADVVQLRKLILGIYKEFPENNSWRFVDAGQTYADEEYPWPVKEYINLENDNTVKANQNFHAIKIGDVNGSTTVNATSKDDVTEVRSASAVNFLLEDRRFEAGDFVSIPVTAAEALEIFGYQFTLDFDATLLSFEGIQSGIHEISSQHINNNLLSDGKLSVSYDNARMTNTSTEEAMFYVNFTALDNGSVANTLSFDNSVTKSEIYTNELEAIDLSLNTRTFSQEPLVLLQNTPNPFSTETEIKFVLSEDAPASISIFDITGKALKVINGNYSKGMNSLTLNAADITAQGILYYQVESNGYKVTKKMIVINN